MDKSYETIVFPGERKVKIGNVTYIVHSHFLDHGDTLKDKIIKLIKLKVNELSNQELEHAEKM